MNGVIHSIFNYKKRLFIDLVATNGIIINNTLLLEKELNRDGICIEPNQNFYCE